MNYEIRYVRGHVEVYDQMGRFRFSPAVVWHDPNLKFTE